MKLIKQIFLLICHFVTYLSWAQTTEGKITYIESDKTEFVDIYPDVIQTFPTTKFEWKQIPPYRSTIVNHRQRVKLTIHGEKPNSKYEWKIFRAARDTEEFDSINGKYKLNIITQKQLNERVLIELNNGMRYANRVSIEYIKKNTNELNYRFKKISANDLRSNDYWNHLIYDLYIVNLYEDGIAIDYLYVFVLPKADKTYRERFNTYYEPADDLGNYRSVVYPEWYGHGFNLVQHDDLTYRYGVFYKRSTSFNKSRKGRGMLENRIPALSSLNQTPQDETQKYWSRSTRNAIIHSTNHTGGSEVYYGVSVKIPKDQNWNWIENDETKQSAVILVQLHTADFPNRELPENEGQNFQILFMGNNNFRINYGIAKLAKFQKDLYLDAKEGEWIDFIFRLKYKNSKFKHLTDRNFTEEDELFEMWVSIGNNDFQKVSFEKNTYPVENIDGQEFVPKLSKDKTSVYGPNVVNTNPVYFTLTQYRNVNGLPKPLDVENVVYFDEFITSDNLKLVLKFFNKKMVGTSEFD